MKNSLLRMGQFGTILFVLGGLLGLVALADPRANPVLAAEAPNSVIFSGQAFVVKASVPDLGINTVISDTGALPGSGGALEASLLDVSVPGLLTAEVAHASTVGQGDRSRSEASVASLNLVVGGNSIAADFLMSRAMAVCGAAPTGSSEIANLVVNGQTIT
ncbi:MAG TPA: choice-of-anchor P family protein, partial [Candidatus Udaeobacter sp.]|nr:choice-of-anchor P family protein [Candidatus Udaeobacter sp.]